MKENQTRKLALAGLLTAVAVVGSLLSFPILGSKCSPVQHMVNILCSVLLGPGYSLAAAFSAALLRNLLGLGSLLAFPGSCFGAALSGLAYRRWRSLSAAVLGEIFGTAVLGGLCAYPVAVLFMGQDAAGAALTAYVFPFFLSTAVGSLLSTAVLTALEKSHILAQIQTTLSTKGGR